MVVESDEKFLQVVKRIYKENEACESKQRDGGYSGSPQFMASPFMHLHIHGFFF